MSKQMTIKEHFIALEKRVNKLEKKLKNSKPKKKTKK